MNFDEKYYRVYASIDLDAIYHNAVEIKKILKDGVGLTAVIKTDGYGHGAIPIAYKLESVADSYAVATIDEALNLVNHNVKKPIYIIGFTHKSRVQEAVDNEIRLTVYDYKMAETISEISKGMAKIHIKIDTGMSRIGFCDNEEAIETLIKISKLPNISIEGIFTHFASADDIDKSSANQQLTRFNDFIEKLELAGLNIPIKHCSNSAGIFEIREADFNCVRAGISLYGIYPSCEVDLDNRYSLKLKEVLTLVSHIIQIKELDENIGISYGSTFVTRRKTKVATIPVGYGDGYPRSLSNNGYVLIRGQKANILGRVCMDQFMVDVTDIEGVSDGDEVVLVGEQGQEKIKVEDLSVLSNRFPYEFVCDLGKRIPRVYFSEKRLVCTKDYFEDQYKMFD